MSSVTASALLLVLTLCRPRGPAAASCRVCWRDLWSSIRSRLSAPRSWSRRRERLRATSPPGGRPGSIRWGRYKVSDEGGSGVYGANRISHSRDLGMILRHEQPRSRQAPRPIDPSSGKRVADLQAKSPAICESRRQFVAPYRASG